MLLTVTANDIDIKPMLTYDLLTSTDMFAVDKYSGKVSLTGKLDYETRTSYNLSIMVRNCIFTVKNFGTTSTTSSVNFQCTYAV